MSEVPVGDAMLQVAVSQRETAMGRGCYCVRGWNISAIAANAFYASDFAPLALPDTFLSDIRAA